VSPMKSYEKYKQVSPTFLQTDIDMRRYLLSVIFTLSGLYMIVGIFTMAILPLVVSGDSTMQRKSVTSPLLTPPSAEIR